MKKSCFYFSFVFIFFSIYFLFHFINFFIYYIYRQIIPILISNVLTRFYRCLGVEWDNSRWLGSNYQFKFFQKKYSIYLFNNLISCQFLFSYTCFFLFFFIVYLSIFIFIQLFSYSAIVATFRQQLELIRGAFRAPPKSKMELFAKIVQGKNPLFLLKAQLQIFYRVLNTILLNTFIMICF